MRWHFGVEILLAEENNILQHKHRQQQKKDTKKNTQALRERGAWTTELACHLSMCGLLDKSSSDCFVQTTTQTHKLLTETKVVPALWWEPCRLVGSHSSSMHTPCLHLHLAVPNIASCADHASEKATHKIILQCLSHGFPLLGGRRGIGPWGVGTMLSPCQSQLCHACVCHALAIDMLACIET